MHARWHTADLAEQQQLVQLLVEAAAGLVDGGHNGPGPLRQLPQQLQQVHGCCAVQTLQDMQSLVTDCMALVSMVLCSAEAVRYTSQVRCGEWNPATKTSA